MIRGQKRALDKKPSVNVNLNASIHNRFDIEVVDARTGEVKQRAEAYNIILNSLWSRLQSSLTSNWANYIHYGSGTTTPSATDTSLSGFIASVSISTVTDNFDKTNRVFSSTYKITLSETTAVGKNISEVGLAYGNSASNLVTKALLQDMNGNQITIQKTDTDIINIYATVFVHMLPENYDSGHITQFKGPLLGFLAGRYESVNGIGNKRIGTDVVVSAASKPVDGRGTFQPYGYASVLGLTPSFDASTKRLIMSTGRAAAGTGNQNGWSAISVGINSYYGDSQDFLLRVGGSWYPGTQITGEAIGTGDGTTVDFSTKFGFVNNPIIYVDGVAVSDVTVDLDALINPYENYVGMLNSIDKQGTPICVTAHNPNYEWRYFENPNWETIGITYTRNSSNTIQASNDLSTWVDAVGTVPEEYQHYRYWRSNDYYVFSYGIKTTETRTTNIHFASPPPDGAVITADYFTKTIAKDENHVFDFSMTIQLGEYTE